jgi:ribonuclease D
MTEQAEPQWIESDAALGQLISTVRDEPAYGLDTEFMSERSYWPRLCLLQVSWAGGVALVDALACDVAALGDLLRSPGTAITHAGAADLPILDRACGTRPTGLFDTQLAAGFVGLGTPSLSSLITELLGIRPEASEVLNDWTRRPLSKTARRYAAGDVAHLLALTAELRSRLDGLGREAWVAAECEILRTTPAREQDPDTAWWGLKGARSMKGERARVAQSVAAWRELRARERDQPVRFVLGDLALAAVVGRPPRTTEDVKRLRGAGSLPAPVAQAVVEAVEAGRALPSSDLRRPPGRVDAPGLDAAIGILSAWVGEIAASERVEQRLLATRDDVRSLVNGRPSRLDNGWRAELVGDRLHELLAGAAVLRLVDGGRRVRLEPSPRPG